jgi:hypothetical protein
MALMMYSLPGMRTSLFRGRWLKRVAVGKGAAASEKFDSISNQIIEWTNKSEKEKDGQALIQDTRLISEKATNKAAWYACFCRTDDGADQFGGRR